MELTLCGGEQLTLCHSGAERTLGLVLVPRRHRVDVKARAEDAAEAEAQQG